ASRRRQTLVRGTVERLPQSFRSPAAAFEYRSRVFRTEFSTRTHRASGRNKGFPDRVLRACRSRFALSESRISRSALPPPTRPGCSRLQAWFESISKQGHTDRPP